MDSNKNQIMSMLSKPLDDNMNMTHASSTGNYTSEKNLFLESDKNLSCWHYWQDYYYPNVIRESYPVYIREQAQDKGRKAFEIIKMLKDKKIIKLDTVSDFIDAMDELIKMI